MAAGHCAAMAVRMTGVCLALLWGCVALMEDSDSGLLCAMETLVAAQIDGIDCDAVNGSTGAGHDDDLLHAKAACGTFSACFISGPTDGSFTFDCGKFAKFEALASNPLCRKLAANVSLHLAIQSSTKFDRLDLFSPSVRSLVVMVDSSVQAARLPELWSPLSDSSWANLQQLEIEGNFPLTFLMDRPWPNLTNLTISQAYRMLLNLTSLSAPQLMTLQLNFNEMMESHLPTTAPLLSALKLSHNSLVQVPTLAAYTMLTVVDLSFNEISALPALPLSLISLDLSDNILAEAGAGNLSAPVLRRLSLNNNGLLVLPQLAAPLLEELNIAGNQLDNRALLLLSGFPDLTRLIGCGNRFTRVAHELAHLRHLEALQLSRNSIEHIDPEAFSSLVSLRELLLEHNLLTSFPAGLLSSLNKLTVLLLSNNRISSLEEGLLDHNTALETVMLNTNPLSTVPDTLLLQLTRLQSFSLENASGLAALPEDIFQNSQQLQTVYLGYNRLTKLPASLFTLLPKLVHLAINDNELRTWDNGFFGRIETLNVSNAFAPGVNVPVDSIVSSGMENLTRLEAVGLTLGARLMRKLYSLTRLERLALGGNSLCDADAKPELSAIRFRLQSLVLRATGCTFLEIPLVFQRNATVEVVQNVHLQELTFVLAGANSTAKEHFFTLNLRDNPMLEKVAPWMPAFQLDISRTRIPYTPWFCNVVGSRQLQAIGMLDATSYTTEAVGHLLSDCLSTVLLLDLSNNDFVNNLTLVSSVVDDVFVLSDGIPTSPLYGEVSRVRLREQGQVAFLSLLGVPLECTVEANIIDAFDVNHVVWKTTAYKGSCECSPGYKPLPNGRCDQPGNRARGFVREYTTLFVLLLAVLVGAIILLGVAYWPSVLQLLQLKRLQKMVDPHRIDSQHLENELIIGQGAFARVTRARWHGCPVAVKRMLHVLSESLEDRWAFYREMDFMLRARHGNLVHCFGWGEDQAGLPFVVLQYVDGGDLRSRLRAQPAMDVLVSLALGIARGMAYLHDTLHINHRDLKPENVLVEHGPPLRALVADFGSVQEFTEQPPEDSPQGSPLVRRLSKIVGRDQGTARRATSSSSLERRLLELKPSAPEDSLVGTSWYLAPEHMKLRPGPQPKQLWAPAADAYSYGVILFEMLTRLPPDLVLVNTGSPYEGPASGYWRQAHQLLSRGACLWDAPGTRGTATCTEWPEAYECCQALSRDCLCFRAGKRPSFRSIELQLQRLHEARAATESAL